jgi:hypothetical protein
MTIRSSRTRLVTVEHDAVPALPPTRVSTSSTIDEHAYSIDCVQMLPERVARRCRRHRPHGPVPHTAHTESTSGHELDG